MAKMIETKERLEIEKEEMESCLKMLETARQKFIQYGYINEGGLPIDDSIEFRKMMLEWLDNKIEITEDLEQEIESSISFYEI